MDTILPIQCRLARMALAWGLRDLAREAAISPNTVARFERGERLLPRTIVTLRATFEKAGIVFIDQDDSGGPGIRLRDHVAEPAGAVVDDQA